MDDSGSKGGSVHGSRRGQGQPALSRGAAAQERGLRRAIVDACLAMNRLGLNQGAAGNISVRCGADMLITPSAIPYDDLRPEMIARLSLARAEPSRPAFKPSTEWRLHRDVLRARPEVGAVVHCHAAHATALSILRLPLPPVHYMIACFGGSHVRCAPYAPFGTQEFSDVAIVALTDRTAALLGNHGAVALGVDLADAMRRAHELETLARMYLLARMAGEPTLLTSAEVTDAIARFTDYQAGARRPQP